MTCAEISRLRQIWRVISAVVGVLAACVVAIPSIQAAAMGPAAYSYDGISQLSSQTHALPAARIAAPAREGRSVALNGAQSASWALIGFAAEDGLGAGSGPWADGVGAKPGGAVGQTTGGSCVSACGEMLSGGSVTQQALLDQIGEWSNPQALAHALGDGWAGGYFGSGSDALAAAEQGPMGAALRAPGAAGHMVVTTPLGDGQFLVQDPWAGGSTYQVGSSWIEQYVAGGVFR
jgi:hypothetical protein